MPIHKCRLPGGKQGYKYGNQGKCYPTKKQALEQMKAIFSSGYKEKKK